MYKIGILDKISYVLIILGAVNWGLLGLFNFNLVHSLIGALPVIERIIYILILVSGINSTAIIVRSKINITGESE